MKRLVAILLVTVLMMTFLVGCGKDRMLYKDVKLENYLEVKDYLGIEIDSTSEDFVNIYNEMFNMDVQDYKLLTEVTEGVVENWDTVNLDYEGKIDGVAFEGGTAQGYDLTIGSKKFIDDFEEELIGVAVGETKDVTAKFPENYDKAELAGKEAIFTCKVNHIKKPMTEEEAYSKMGFDTAEDYKNDIKKRSAKQFILSTIAQTAKIIDYPKKDQEILGDAIYGAYVEMYQLTEDSFNQMLSSQGYTVESFKSEVAIDMMNVNMLMYYIADAEELEVLESTINSQNISQPAIAESYAVQDTVMEYLYDNAKIK